jgi:hypothetical protein
MIQEFFWFIKKDQSEKVCFNTSFEPKIASNPPDSLTHVRNLSHLPSEQFAIEKVFRRKLFSNKDLSICVPPVA